MNTTNSEGNWNIIWHTAAGKREILRAKVSRSMAFAWRMVFPWCFIEEVK